MSGNHTVGQNAKRAAVRSALTRHKEFISTKRFYSGGDVTARVIVDGEAYEVSGRQLALLERGKTPADLPLEPLPH